MSRHQNHRGWFVLASFASSHENLCVDFFEDDDGRVGFEHLRADPEDGGRWTAVGGFATSRFDSKEEAVDAALDQIGWMSNEPQVRSDIAAWRRQASE